MTDVHCHLGEGEIKNIEWRVVTSGTNEESSKRAVELANKYPHVWATVGVHPEEITNFKFLIFNQLKNLLNSKKVVGVGEIGLDYKEGITEEEKQQQKELFKTMVELAEEADKPVVVHNRNADEDIWEMLKDYRGKAIMHCFTRNEEFMKKCVRRSWYISFGGLLLRENNSRMRKVATLVPNEYLLVETDAPYVTPMNVKLVAETLALLRKVDMKEIEKITDQNADRVFKCIN